MTYHAKDRFQERYNREFTWRDLKEMARLVTIGEALPLHNSPTTPDPGPGLAFYYVVYEHIPYRILITDPKEGRQRSIVTVYPLDVDEYNSAVEKHKKSSEEALVDEFLRIFQTKGA
jgi:hypothetical protein